VDGHLVIGVLPDDGSAEATATRAAQDMPAPNVAALDVAVFTGLVVSVLSADVMGAGTASEAAQALKAGKPLILVAAPPIWSNFFRSLGGAVATAKNAEGCYRRIADGKLRACSFSRTAP
jgi:hypothetical protein